MVAKVDAGQREQAQPDATSQSQALLAEIRMLLDAYNEGCLTEQELIHEEQKAVLAPELAAGTG